MSYQFNMIDCNTIQIFGSVNGLATRSFYQNRWSWQYEFYYFKDNCKHTVQNHAIRTLGTVEQLKNKVAQIINDQ